MSRKDKMIAVFEDTEKIYLKKFDNDVNSYKLSNSDITIIKENEKTKAGNVLVLEGDTISVATKYKDTNTAILNMASWKNPGGGVRRGSVAQEECLCRSTNLLYTLERQNYPIGYNELIYSHDITAFKDFNYNPMKPYTVDVITSPAPNIRNGKPRGYEDILEKKIDLMFYSAYNAGVDTIILGAWGCGVYKNDPSLIAEKFNKALEKYRYCFENIIFAVINDRNSVDNNYEIFKKTIK